MRAGEWNLTPLSAAGAFIRLYMVIHELRDLDTDPVTLENLTAVSLVIIECSDGLINFNDFNSCGQLRSVAVYVQH